MKHINVASLFLVIIICFCFTSCGFETVSENNDDPSLMNCSLIHNESTTGVYLDISIDDFNKLGFEYGDSVSLAFSNGFKMEDIPYYNGYYVEAYAPLLVSYPGADDVKATVNYGDDLWITAGLNESDTCNVTLFEKGKYYDIQKANDIHYSDNRDDYPSDEVFANYRNITTGNIKEGILYRSASPCDNIHNRASYTDKLISKDSIGCIVDLADNDEKIQEFIASDDFDSPYFLGKYQDSDVLALNLSMNCLSEDFQKTLCEGLSSMTDMEGPYLIHCTEGKDRTGFVCALLEALCESDYDEIVNDYMITYDNYYGINEKSDPERYNTIKEQNLDVLIGSFVLDDSVDISDVDLSLYAKEYLMEIGMSENTVDKLINILTDNKD